MITTKVYRLSRTELARLTAIEYIRRFWFFAIPIPIIGLIALITMRGPGQVFGMLAILWPFSIPARSVLVSSKASRLYTKGCHVEATEDEITFIGEYVDMKRLRFVLATDRIQQAVRVPGMTLLRMRLPGFAPVKDEAFQSEADRIAFLNLVDEAIAKRIVG